MLAFSEGNTTSQQSQNPRSAIPIERLPPNKLLQPTAAAFFSLSFTLFRMAGSAALLSRPEFAEVYRLQGLVVWVRAGQVVTVTPVPGVADEVWLANTRELLAAEP